MEDQTNEKYFKNGKNNLNNFKNSVHDTIFNFFPILKCCCDEPL